jgi:hypothetical protein
MREVSIPVFHHQSCVASVLGAPSSRGANGSMETPIGFEQVMGALPCHPYPSIDQSTLYSTHVSAVHRCCPVPSLRALPCMIRPPPVTRPHQATTRYRTLCTRICYYSTLLCVTPKRCSPPNFTVTTENEHHHVLYARISRHGFDYVQEYQTPGSQEMIARERCAGVAKNSIQSTRMDSVAGPPQRDYKSRQPNYLPP